jgi:hypothetical protein
MWILSHSIWWGATPPKNGCAVLCQSRCLFTYHKSVVANTLLLWDTIECIVINFNWNSPASVGIFQPPVRSYSIATGSVNDGVTAEAANLGFHRPIGRDFVTREWLLYGVESNPVDFCFGSIAARVKTSPRSTSASDREAGASCCNIRIRSCVPRMSVNEYRSRTEKNAASARSSGPGRLQTPLSLHCAHPTRSMCPSV